LEKKKIKQKAAIDKRVRGWCTIDGWKHFQVNGKIKRKSYDWLWNVKSDIKKRKPSLVS